MPFMINFWWSCPTNFKNEFSKNFVFTWFSSPKIAHKKIPTENYRKFSLISMVFLLLSFNFWPKSPNSWCLFWINDSQSMNPCLVCQVIWWSIFYQIHGPNLDLRVNSDWSVLRLAFRRNDLKTISKRFRNGSKRFRGTLTRGYSS